MALLWLTFCFVWFLSSYTTLIYAAYGNMDAWRQEIDASIRRNFIGHCGIHVTDDNLPLSANSSSQFLIRRIYPTKHEFRQYSSLPITLTKADSRFWEASKLNGYSYEKWGKEDFSRWEIPTDHPGQDRNFCLNMTELAGSGKVISYYEDQRKHIERASYIASIQRAFIHPSGSVGAKCGYFMAQENCETRWDYAKKWHSECITNMKKNHTTWDDFWDDENNANKIAGMVAGCTDKTDLGVPSGSNKFIVTRHKKVFIMDALWDYNFHHFIADGLARMIRFYSFLKANPDIKIHIRTWEDYDLMWRGNYDGQKHAKKMRKQFFDLFDLHENRFISGPVLAEEVFIPRCLHCSWALSNPIEIRLLAKLMVHNARTYIKAHPELMNTESVAVTKKGKNKPILKKNLIILQRTSGDSDRSWTDEMSTEVLSAFTAAYPEHNIILMSSKKSTEPDYCLACELLKFASADVLVGEHGAGLTNMMFMPTNSLVVELVGSLKDVSMPICGYYGPYAAINGHHHYLHGYDIHKRIPLDPKRAADNSAAFYHAIKNKQINYDEVIRVVNRTVLDPAINPAFALSKTETNTPVKTTPATTKPRLRKMIN